MLLGAPIIAAPPLQVVACEQAEWLDSSPQQTAAPPSEVTSFSPAEAPHGPHHPLYGHPPLQMSSKRLFCLCQTSPTYLKMVDSYVQVLSSPKQTHTDAQTPHAHAHTPPPHYPIPAHTTTHHNHHRPPKYTHLPSHYHHRLARRFFLESPV